MTKSKTSTASKILRFAVGSALLVGTSACGPETDRPFEATNEPAPEIERQPTPNERAPGPEGPTDKPPPDPEETQEDYTLNEPAPE